MKTGEKKKLWKRFVLTNLMQSFKDQLSLLADQWLTPGLHQK